MKKKIKYPNPKAHICAYNDGKQKCRCYYLAIRNFKKLNK